MKSLRHVFTFAATTAALMMGALALNGAEAVTVTSGVSSNEVYVGEPFRYQIQVSGSDAPDEPDFSAPFSTPAGWKADRKNAG